MSMVIFALSRQMPFVFKNFIDLAMGVCQKKCKAFSYTIYDKKLIFI